MRWWLWLFLCWTTLANAHDSLNHLPLQQWKNAPSDSTLAQAIAADEAGTFQLSHGNGVSAGYTHQVQWLKLTAPTQSQLQRRVYLTVYPSYLDDIQLFYQNTQGEWQQRTAGDLLPFTQREWPDNRFIFELDTQQLAAQQPLYLRLQTSSTSLMIVEWAEPHAYMRQAQLGFWWLGLELGVLFTLIVAQFISGLWQRETLFRAYLIYLAVLFITLLSHHGLLAWLFTDNLPPWLSHHATSMTTLAHNLSIILFYRSVLSINRATAPWLNGAVWFMLTLIALGLLSVLFGFYVDIIPLVLMVSMLLWLAFFHRAWKLMRRATEVSQQREQQVLIFATLIAYAGNLLLIGSVLGWLPVAGWLIYAVNVTLVVLVLSFQWIVSHRIADLSRAKQQAELQVVTSKTRLQQALAAKEEQGRLLDMLNHELKNPLAVIRMALARLALSDKVKSYAEQAVQDMNAILERCTYSDKLEHHRLSPVKQQFDLTQVLNQWLTPYPCERLALTLAPESIELFSDAEWLRVIVTNLVENALKYGDKSQPVQIQLVPEGSAQAQSVLLLSVCNAPSSLGFPDAQQLFSKYYRAEKAKSQPGTGLGLYIVNILVDALGYQLTYAVRENHICFNLRITTS